MGVGILIGLLAAVGVEPDELPETVAESSGFEATSTSQECDAFLRRCDAAAEHVRRLDFGLTFEGRDMGAVLVARPDAALDTRDQRLRILIIGNIHSGECAGKEALLMLLRDLTQQPDHAWLQSAVLVLVPNYNADANDRMELDNRPGQLGPARGMGRRANAQGLDLNRDFMKIESPEAAALIRLMTEFDPHVFIDCHTTNGSRHRYDLTYDIPHNPATAESLRHFLRQDMMPRVTEQLEQRNTPTFFYGNFNRDHTTWTTYGYEPRYSTEYAGLRGRLGILAEAYSYIPYRERIRATREFVAACLTDATQHADHIRRLCEEVDAELTHRESGSPPPTLSVRAEPVAFPDPVIVRGFLNDRPHDYECRFVGDYRTVNSVPLPEAWLVPAELTDVIDLLRRHGIRMSRLKDPAVREVDVDTVTEVVRAAREFQGHHLLQISVDRQKSQRTIPAGTITVPSRQPLGRLAGYLLEPESDDGIVAWNLLDDVIAVGSEYPILRSRE